MRQIGGVIEELETIKAKRKKAAFSWKTGFNSLDKVLVSYREGDVVVVAGRPGMGKTAFCLSTILNVLPGTKRNIYFFSNQMCAEQLVLRLMAMIAGVSPHEICSDKLKNRHAIDLAKAKKVLLSAKRFFLDDSIDILNGYIERKIKNTENHMKPLVIIDDFARLLKKDNYYDGCEREFPEVDYISKQIKRLADNTGAVILLGVTLSRELEEEGITRPSLELLGENRAILNLANKVILLYRESYYVNQLNHSSPAEIIIAKNDSGPVGVVKLDFDDNAIIFKEPTRAIKLK